MVFNLNQLASRAFCALRAYWLLSQPIMSRNSSLHLIYLYNYGSVSSSSSRVVVAIVKRADVYRVAGMGQM